MNISGTYERTGADNLFGLKATISITISNQAKNEIRIQSLAIELPSQERVGLTGGSVIPTVPLAIEGSENSIVFRVTPDGIKLLARNNRLPDAVRFIVLADGEELKSEVVPLVNAAFDSRGDTSDGNAYAEEDEFMREKWGD